MIVTCTKVRDVPEWAGAKKPWTAYQEPAAMVSSECHFLYDVVTKLGPGNYANLGAYRGGSAAFMAFGLKEINAEDIKGYDKEEFTHMGVASAVASGAADTGMGILTAAIALDLEFVPIAKERYDLVIRGEHFKTAQMEALFQIISTDTEFRNAVVSLGGYDVSEMGKVVYEQ